MRKLLSSLVAGSMLFSAMPAAAVMVDVDGSSTQAALISNYRSAATNRVGRRMTQRAHAKRVMRWRNVRKECKDAQGKDRVRCMSRFSRTLETTDSE